MLKKFFTIFGLSFFLLSCEYDHEKTMKHLIWSSIQQNNLASSTKVNTVPIQILSTYDALETYPEYISEIEFQFLRNDLIFDFLEKGATFWNNSLTIGHEENLKQSYQNFSTALQHIETFLSQNSHQKFEDISYVYYVYVGTLHSAKDCYIRYETYKYHLPFVAIHEKNLIDQKLTETWNKIKQNNIQMGHYLASVDVEKH